MTQAHETDANHQPANAGGNPLAHRTGTDSAPSWLHQQPHHRPQPGPIIPTQYTPMPAPAQAPPPRRNRRRIVLVVVGLVVALMVPSIWLSFKLVSALTSVSRTGAPTATAQAPPPAQASAEPRPSVTAAPVDQIEQERQGVESYLADNHLLPIPGHNGVPPQDPNAALYQVFTWFDKVSELACRADKPIHGWNQLEALSYTMYLVLKDVRQGPGSMFEELWSQGVSFLPSTDSTPAAGSHTVELLDRSGFRVGKGTWDLDLVFENGRWLIAHATPVG